ncbi:MAG: glycosyltransferase family 4 protein [Acidimicrobiales bacterium]
MKILLVSPFLPSPPRFGGQRRIDGLVRELANRHDVSVLAFNATDEWEHESLVETRTYCREVRTLSNYEPGNSKVKRRNQLRSLLSRHSYEHSLVAGRLDFQQAFDEMLAAQEYDVVQIEFAQMAAFRFSRRANDGPLFVLDEHNIEYDILRRTSKAAAGFTRTGYNAFNWRKLAREERAAWRRFDGVALTSARDEQLLHEDIPSCRTAVIPNGVDVREFAQSSGAVDADSLVFFGAINYFPNADGVMFFADEVFPTVRRRRPNASFKVIGPGASAEVLARQHGGVEIVGMVDDVNPFIERAAVIVVPLRIGGGTRLKIVEALSKGKPVVSTRLGAEGLDVVDGEHLLLADEPQEFADQIERVLADPALARRLGTAGRTLMEDRYSWGTITRQLEHFYQELLDARP